jgi:hypothetical protein
MTGNDPAPITDAELAQLLAQAAELRQRQRAEALGVRLD